MAETLKGWTDYPITELGDIPGQETPIREAEAIGYKRRKELTWSAALSSEGKDNG